MDPEQIRLELATTAMRSGWDGETESASLRVADTLPPDAKADAVKAVVRQAQGMAFVRKLDWRI